MSAWDPARIASGLVTLSGGNAIATHTSATTNDAAAFGTAFHSSGQWTFTITVGTAVAAFLFGMGTASASSAAGQYLGVDTNSFGVGKTGDVLINNSVTTNIGITWGSGDTIDVAVDLSGKLFWARVNGGNWNGNAANSPGGSGGADLSTVASMTLSPAIATKTQNDAATSKFDNNLGISGWATWDPRILDFETFDARRFVPYSPRRLRSKAAAFAGPSYVPTQLIPIVAGFDDTVDSRAFPRRSQYRRSGQFAGPTFVAAKPSDLIFSAGQDDTVDGRTWPRRSQYRRAGLFAGPTFVAAKPSDLVFSVGQEQATPPLLPRAHAAWRGGQLAGAANLPLLSPDACAVFVQAQRFNNFGTPGQTTVTTASFPAVGINNTVVGSLNINSGISVNSVIDSAGNRYSVSSGVVFDGYGVTQFRFAKIGILGNPTTLTISASADIGGVNNVVFLEYSNVSSINAETSAFVNSVASPISTNLVSTRDGSRIVGIISDDGSSADVGAGFTSRFAFTVGDLAEDQKQTTAGSIAVSFTQVGATQGGVIHAWALSCDAFPDFWLHQYDDARTRRRAPDAQIFSPVEAFVPPPAAFTWSADPVLFMGRRPPRNQPTISTDPADEFVPFPPPFFWAADSVHFAERAPRRDVPPSVFVALAASDLLSPQFGQELTSPPLVRARRRAPDANAVNLADVFVPPPPVFTYSPDPVLFYGRNTPRLPAVSGSTDPASEFVPTPPPFFWGTEPIVFAERIRPREGVTPSVFFVGMAASDQATPTFGQELASPPLARARRRSPDAGVVSLTDVFVPPPPAFTYSPDPVVFGGRIRRRSPDANIANLADIFVPPVAAVTYAPDPVVFIGRIRRAGAGLVVSVFSTQQFQNPAFGQELAPQPQLRARASQTRRSVPSQVTANLPNVFVPPPIIALTVGGDAAPAQLRTRSQQARRGIAAYTPAVNLYDIFVPSAFIQYPPGYDPAPYWQTPPRDFSDIASAQWVRKVVDVVNNSLAGKMNVGLTISLQTGAGSTTITDARISAFSALLLTPLTANAAAIRSSIYVSSQQSGQATLAHSVTANTDCIFVMTILG